MARSVTPTISFVVFDHFGDDIFVVSIFKLPERNCQPEANLILRLDSYANHLHQCIPHYGVGQPGNNEGAMVQ